MKKVEATIQQGKLVEVKNALQGVGVLAVTITEARQVGGATRTMMYRGVTRTIDAIACVRVETVVSDHKVEAVIDAILQHAHTGTADDGTIVVTEATRVVLVRTGEIAASEPEFTGNSLATMVGPSGQSRWDVPSYQHTW